MEVVFLMMESPTNDMWIDDSWQGMWHVVTAVLIASMSTAMSSSSNSKVPSSPIFSSAEMRKNDRLCHEACLTEGDLYPDQLESSSSLRSVIGDE